jgi:formate dehydrogenase major subunit
MGGNPAENHPCGFKWFMEARRTRNAKLVVVDPRFTRTAAVADVYAPVRAGSDIAFLLGIIRYALTTGRFHKEYVQAFTNATYLINEKYGFEDGLFSGFDQAGGSYDKASWTYSPDPKTKAYGVDPTMEDPHCVFQLLKKHVDRYTPEMVERICGTAEGQVPESLRRRHVDWKRPRVGTITYALGWTQHSTGSDHPLRGDAPAAAGQHRPPRRRRGTPSAVTPTSGRDRHGRDI